MSAEYSAESVRVLIMAGGTGGHVFPALAVAEELRRRGAEVHWLGTQRGLERTVVPNANFAMYWIDIRGLRGKGALGWIAMPWRLLKAMRQSRQVFKQLSPDVALGMGGFVSGPGGLVAVLRRVPLVIHEQNAIAGLTNRTLARVAGRVLEGFPGTFPERTGAEHTGNPVREAIAHLPPPEQRLTGRSGPLRLLVLGGSQGAHALNQVVPEAIKRMPAAQRPQIWHQAGQRHLGQTQEWHRQAQTMAKVDDFIDDMARAYAWADLVLCRSGALTLAELTLAGIGAILVPFPFAVDDHQSANAEFLQKEKAAVVVQETDLTPDVLAELLGTLVGERERLLYMASASRALGRPQATAQVADAVLASVRKR